VGLHDLWEGDVEDDDDDTSVSVSVGSTSVVSEAQAAPVPKEVSSPTQKAAASAAATSRPPTTPYNLRPRKLSQMPKIPITTPIQKKPVASSRRPPTSPSRPVGSSGSSVVTPETKQDAATRRREKAAAAAAECFQSQDVSQIERDCVRCTWHLLTGNQRTQRLQMEHKRNRKVSRLIQRKQNRLANLINWTLVQSYQLTAEQQEEQEQHTTYMTTGKRGAITNAKNADEEKLHYYQGYHDVACIFLSTLGGTSSGRIPGIPGTPPLSVPAAASGLDLPAAVLLQVSQSHFRDCMRPNFMCLQTAMRLALMPLIAVNDPDVHAHLFDCDMQPFFCLSWILTWFAHDIRDTAAVKRLFDVFLVSHPLMPMYMSVAMVIHPLNRREVLQTENDFADVHQTLQGLPKNSNMVGFKYRPGDGYVSDDGGDDEDTLSTGAGSLDDADFFVDGRHLDDDGNPHHNTFETESLVSTAMSSIEPPAKVPFQELIDNSVALMQRYPPRTLVALATRYYGQSQVNELLSDASPAGIRMMEAPPAWSSTPTAKADWVLKQRAREKRGLSAKTRRDRRRENKRARSRSRSRGDSVTRGSSSQSQGGGSEVVKEQAAVAAADESTTLKTNTNKGRGKSSSSSAPAVIAKNIQKYLTDNRHTIPVIAIGHGSGDDEERRRRKRRKLAFAGVAAVAVASMVAGAVIQNHRDMALLPTSSAGSNGGEQSASASMVVGEGSPKISAATGTVEKQQPSKRVTDRSSSIRSREEKTPAEQAPRASQETRAPQPVAQEVSVSSPKVTYSSSTRGIPVPPVKASRGSYLSSMKKSLLTSTSQEYETVEVVDFTASALALPQVGGRNSHPLLQRTRGAVNVLSKRVAFGLTKLIEDPRLVKLQPILQFGQWTGGAVSIISKRVSTGLVKLGDNPRHAIMRPLVRFGGWTNNVAAIMWKRAAAEMARLSKLLHSANDVGKTLKDAYDSPGGQEVACALQDAAILSPYSKYKI
jgi:hypothetical protein